MVRTTGIIYAIFKSAIYSDHTKSANHADKQQKLAPHGIDNLHGNDAGYTLPHHVQDNLANSSHGTT